MGCATLPFGDLHGPDESPDGKGSADETEGAACMCCVLPEMWLELEPTSHRCLAQLAAVRQFPRG